MATCTTVNDGNWTASGTWQDGVVPGEGDTAIAPVVMGDSIDLDKAFFASRYGKGGEEDYLNCPLTEEEYDRFYRPLWRRRRCP